ALGRHFHVLAVLSLLAGLHHHDVAPRATFGAVVAADARGLVDGDLEAAHLAGDRPRRALHHADGVGALVAGGGDQPSAVFLALADELGAAGVGVGAAADEFVATRAGREVDQQHALAVDEPGVHRHLQVFAGSRVAGDGAASLQALQRLGPQLVLDGRVFLED